MPTPTAETELPRISVAELAQQLSSGATTSAEATEACIVRIEQVNPSLHAVTVELFDEARQAAREADRVLAECRATGSDPPLMCGVPITIKDCYDIAGTAATLGIESRQHQLATTNSPLVERLRSAGAVILGKTNIPQAMLLHCCDNPLWGRTPHPMRSDRGPGGSSGGEAAIVAAGGSTIGLGSDLGGSIRQPAHVCGLVGFKPTSRRLTNVGNQRSLKGMDAIAIDSGPIAHTVADAERMMQVLVGDAAGSAEADEQWRPWTAPSSVHVSQLTIATAEADGWFEPAPPCRRAVAEANRALQQSAAHVVDVRLPRIDHAIRLYFGLLSADGFRSVRQALRGNRIDWQIRRQSRVARLPRTARGALAMGLRMFGQRWLSTLLTISGPRSADAYWQLTDAARRYAIEFWQQLDAQVGRRVDALVMPPHALPALPHGTALDLLPAASYCYLANLLGAPAGVVPWTTVAVDEQQYPFGTRFDLVSHLARKTMADSAGLPIGVQVLARPWDDHIALAVMAELEQVHNATQ